MKGSRANTALARRIRENFGDIERTEHPSTTATLRIDCVTQPEIHYTNAMSWVRTSVSYHASELKRKSHQMQSAFKAMACDQCQSGTSGVHGDNEMGAVDVTAVMPTQKRSELHVVRP